MWFDPECEVPMLRALSPPEGEGLEYSMGIEAEDGTFGMERGVPLEGDAAKTSDRMDETGPRDSLEDLPF